MVTSASPRQTVLVVEDEQAIADNVLYALRTEGFSVEWRALGHEGVARVRARAVDLVVLDIGLPDGSGLERCKEIRAFSDVPIVFLTARCDEIDRVVGLEIGADDYVTKPFSPRELVARVKNILRRARPASAPLPPPHASPASPSPRHLVVDDERARITWHGKALDLTRYEFLLLRFLAAHPGRVCSRAQLMDAVWGPDRNSLDRTVDAHVKSLRAKLREVTPDDDPIRTHRGLGYSYTDVDE